MELELFDTQTPATGLAPGTLLVDTDCVDPDDRFSYWTDAVVKLFGPNDVQRRDAEPFRGTMLAHRIGPLVLFRNSGDPVAVARPGRPSPSPIDDGISLYLNLAGRCVISVDGRATDLRPGDLLFAADSQPRVVDCDGGRPWSHVILRIPGALVRPHAKLVHERLGCRISGQDGVGWLVRRHLVDLCTILDRAGLRSQQARLANIALQSALMIIDHAHADPTGDSPASHHELLDQVKRYIDDHLGEPDLKPESIARAQFISVRLLYKLFEDEGVGVAQWIRNRRIDRCRQDLTDPQFADETITTIASRWGFTNAPHFSRLFHETCGLSPSAYRSIWTSRGATATQPGEPITS